MIMTMGVIKRFKYCISMFSNKTITKFLKTKFKKTIFDDEKECKSLICTFPLKNRRFFIILPAKFISLNCTAS